MDFELNDEQEHLRDGLRSLLEDSCPIGRVREEAVDGFDPDATTWRVLAENGWPGINISEKRSGAGLGFEEAMIASMEAGRALLHQPLTETIVASRALERHASTDFHLERLEAVARGAVRFSIALSSSPEEPADGAHPIRVKRTGDGWSLRGAARAVPFGPHAEACLLEAGLPEGGRVLLVLDADHPGARWTERPHIDRTVRRFDLALDGVSLGATAELRTFSRGAPEIDWILNEWRALLAAQNEGACRRMLEMTTAYAAQRIQFGRPVGSNQAVKVRIAEMAAAVERMRAAIYHAAMKIEQNAPDAPLAVAMAKNASGVPGSFVATQAIHVHGALGFTWEQDLQLFVKRVKTNELLLGGERECLARIAAAVLDEV